MKLSTKGRYAVLAMIELALNEKKALLPLADLSLSQEISISYLEQLFAKLRSNDLVTGVRGPRGGYRLSRPANQITVAEILRAVDEKSNPAAIEETHQNEKFLKTSELWSQLSKQIYSYLDSITLADVIATPPTAEAAGNEVPPSAEEPKAEPFRFDSSVNDSSAA